VDLIAALRSFLRIAETGSFSAVAQERGVTQPAISRQITSLEQHLGTRLVHRSTQAVTLTEEGRDLLAAARQAVEAADAVLQATSYRRGKPVGRVRVGASVAFGAYLTSRFGRLLGQHEELAIDLILRDTAGNLVERGLDVEIRRGLIHESGLVARRIGSTMTFLVASPLYLDGRAAPTHPRDLEQHDCLVHHRSGRDDVWCFNSPGARDETNHGDPEISVTVHGRFRANNASAVHRAALDGFGIALLPHLLVIEDIRAGRLRHLLPEFPTRRFPLYVTFPSRRSLPPRTRAVIDFIIEALRDDPAMRLDAAPAIRKRTG
jgi:DNA-binding transcriptional LysR family regulator